MTRTIRRKRRTKPVKTKRITKQVKTKRKKNKYKKTKKNIYGGYFEGTGYDYKEEQRYRTQFSNIIFGLINQKLNKKQKESLISNTENLFREHQNMINSLIPITNNGRPVNKETYNRKKTPIIDFVSPVIVIFDNLTGQISETKIKEILGSYYRNGGNFNALSRKNKLSPLQNELNKERLSNVEILLDQNNEYHIMNETINEDMKLAIEDLRNKNIPVVVEEPNVVVEKPDVVVEEPNVVVEKPDVVVEPIISYPKLQLPYETPIDNNIGYDRETVPDFWKPIFQDGAELLKIKNDFMKIYENYQTFEKDVTKQKKIQICEILERIIPAYTTRYAMFGNESIKTVINVNILNCYITLLYGIILCKLYDTKQDFLFLFKGGRAIQINLTGIQISKYFSEDTDILIVPNHNVEYNLEKMRNLSEHIAYLMKWIVPDELNIIISLYNNPKNSNNDITKLLYNDNRIFKALSDIGFGEIPLEAKPFFELNNMYYTTKIFINEFELELLFILPDKEDMLKEKLFYYSKYLISQKELDRNKATEPNYQKIKQDNQYYLFKFKNAITKLLEADMIVRNELQFDTNSYFNVKLDKPYYSDKLRNILRVITNYNDDEINMFLRSLSIG